MHDEEFSRLETTTCVLTFEFAICKFKLAFMRENASSAGPLPRRDIRGFFVKSHSGVEECGLLHAAAFTWFVQTVVF